MYQTNPYKKYTTQIALLIVALSILISVYSAQYGFGYAPCQLCQWQRIPWWIIVVVCIMSLLFNRYVSRRFHLYVLWITFLALIASTGLAAFHAGVEYNWWPGLASCSTTQTLPTTSDEIFMAFGQPAPDCTKPAWIFLYLSMAGWNALISFIAACYCLFGIWKQ